ncbi:MAG: helix-turn-helix transcriptional regulator [Muribaculaceae bacterium]|nr:helix-turn-helix transcriptional regulator [Muribaculaceae bacterium]
MSDFNVIILTHDTLNAIGLRSIFENSFGISAYIADEHYIDTFNTTKEPHLFFVDSLSLVANLGFFLPRRAKTVLLTNDHTPSDDFRTLCVNDNESDIINIINTFFTIGNEVEKNTTNSLSQREIEVLRLIAAGKINKEIAQELNISINTVLSHRKNLTSKLVIKSISGLTFYAMMNGIV